MKLLFPLLVGALLFTAPGLRAAGDATPAALRLAAPFTDHAVLQRDQPVPVWGWCTPGDSVSVAHRDHAFTTVADATGRWSGVLAPSPARADGAELVVTTGRGGAVTLRDIVIGEVWLASGQSNMEWPLRLARGGPDEVAGVANPLLRHLRIEHTPSDDPVATVPHSGWRTAAPDTAGDFSAIGYFFARELIARLGVPVGLIHSSWGGTPIESWLPAAELRRSSDWPRFAAEWREALRGFPEKSAAYPALDAAWRQADAAARTSGQPNPLPWPHPPVGPGTAYAPGALYEGMIAPLAPYALRGFLWYQGESNVGRAAAYAELFPALIRAWRAAWAADPAPAFLFVQLPNYSDHRPDGRAWAALREAQAAALALPGTGMAVAIDGDEPDNLHPTDKRGVAGRLARLAVASAPGLAVETSGPTLVGFRRDGPALRLEFAQAEGLHLMPLRAGGTGLELAGADRQFHPATVEIEGDTVVLMAAAVPEPVAARHAWTNAPAAVLRNAAGLPAAPFRTDAWPVED